ncbi:Poly-beta-1,6-N-acetyl-D-glucosamine N-deacetylase [Hydrogenovibrio crunogenus]|uniref:Poly-beta-1,6-N-acetyl-D-glucosamine N-deacetylase n=1 Tax=Hydrogenovibrio crunogenus TaxID=39765 RepID=A0A4P7NWI1_9GAMM|nr:polysaccharide deacetylase family protein [Hydrogenovibrio crunogenus]QBZ81997.1 Poly-beta-1,6-N-acetyl-D-glucosamine N-deacetylase [Hydrogenovibrio crunogenus]
MSAAQKLHSIVTRNPLLFLSGIGTLIVFISTFVFLTSNATPPPKQAVSDQAPSPVEHSNSAVILIYHHFGKNEYPSTNIRLAQFDAQLDYLEQNQFNVWSLSQLVTALKNQTPIPEKTVVFTIDDAWKSVYTEAFPRFKKRGWPMTVFVNTDAIDKGYQSNMTWEQMREMQQYGAEFANHAKTHQKLVQQPDESYDTWKTRVTQEIKVAQQRLKSELGEQTNQTKLFSYPYGEYSEALANLVQKMGYVGIAQNSGAVGYQSDLRALMRFPMSEVYADMDAFKLKVNTHVFPVNKITPFDPVITENPPKMILEFANPPQRNIQCFNQHGEPLLLNWASETRLEVTSDAPLDPPRSRYACTQMMPNGDWRWISHGWVISHKNNMD